MWTDSAAVRSSTDSPLGDRAQAFKPRDGRGHALGLQTEVSWMLLRVVCFKDLQRPRSSANFSASACIVLVVGSDISNGIIAGASQTFVVRLGVFEQRADAGGALLHTRRLRREQGVWCDTARWSHNAVAYTSSSRPSSPDATLLMGRVARPGSPAIDDERRRHALHAVIRALRRLWLR